MEKRKVSKDQNKHEKHMQRKYASKGMKTIGYIVDTKHKNSLWDWEEEEDE